MPLIEKITQMQKQGITNEEIIKTLQDEGVSPREISEAFEQIAVKSTVSSGELGETGREDIEEMQPSLLSEEASQESAQISQTQAQQPISSTSPTTEEEYSPYPLQQYQEQYPTQAEQYAEYQYSPQTSTETITEIAEQIVDEKLQKIQTQLSETTKFKIETEGKVNDLNERLKRIEMIIDRLQASIIGKIGEYSKDISNLKQEIETTQESVSKVLEPLTRSEKKAEVRKTETREAKHHARGKRKDGFEHYLRR